MFEQYKDVVNISDLTEMLGISKKTAYTLVNSGDIKSFAIGRKIKIPKVFIIEYINPKIWKCYFDY